MGELNVSPDDNIYPLGSCTMKYNPTSTITWRDCLSLLRLHPKAPIEDVQGCLQILFETQSSLKRLLV